MLSHAHRYWDQDEICIFQSSNILDIILKDAHYNVAVGFALFNLLTTTPSKSHPYNSHLTQVDPRALKPPPHVDTTPIVRILDFLALSEPMAIMSQKSKRIFWKYVICIYDIFPEDF